MFLVKTNSFKITTKIKDSSHRAAVLITDYNDKPLALKSFPGVVQATSEVVKTVVLDMINSLLHEEEISVRQCQMLAIEYGIPKTEVDRLIAEASGVSSDSVAS